MRFNNVITNIVQFLYPQESNNVMLTITSNREGGIDIILVNPVTQHPWDDVIWRHPFKVKRKKPLKTTPAFSVYAFQFRFKKMTV